MIAIQSSADARRLRLRYPGRHWIDRCGQDVLAVSGVYQNSFGGKPHEYGTEKDFEGEIMGCEKDHR
jgi:hypothetical protein